MAKQKRLRQEEADRIAAETTTAENETEPLVEAGAGIQEGQWFDLMPHIIQNHHVIAGNWSTGEGVISTTGASKASRIALPLNLEICSYEVSVQFVRTSGNDAVGINLPVGEQSTFMVLNGWPHLGGRSHLEKVNGLFPDHNENAVRGMLIQNDQEQRCRVRVELLPNDEAQISVSLNENELFSWRGRQADLSTSRAWSLHDNAKLGLGAWRSATRFEEVRIRLLSGDPTLEIEQGSHATESE